jgi:ubiquinone/menaquinone biosynthesis C-methylase UbiE
MVIMVEARYDGHAGWYDTTLRRYGDASAELLARLLGTPDGDPVCVDIGCGTGLHFQPVRDNGFTVVGVDVSADQLRIAATRNPRLVRGDARRLPLRDAAVSAVTMTYTHTDIDDFPAAVAEATRILRPGGRLVYVGLHPAYKGAFLDRLDEAAQQRLTVLPGYGEEGLQGDPTGRYPIRSRVGSRDLTLQTFLAAFLCQPRLRLTSFTELDTNLRPWRADPSDHHILPWNLALTAQAD